jgi:hypothetical protein
MYLLCSYLTAENVFLSHPNFAALMKLLYAYIVWNYAKAATKWADVLSSSYAYNFYIKNFLFQLTLNISFWNSCIFFGKAFI